MSVVARKEYVAVPRDRVENFHGKQLVYVSWDHHLLFAAPFLLCLPPQTAFGELLDSALQPLLQADPDAAAIDWGKVEWLKDNQPWVPDFERSLADNGIAHKGQLRMRTPGLNSLCAVS
ncbi:phenol hydroxylase subunit P4 [Azotobacter beijerinckii]|uniref:Phenol hydroxylase P4 protein n=1 Tax=Azotobacter beijerinckii TaxID=170623 RepID=A0A1I4BWW1_9GAMM|nr:phenol hydroxylase subunit P4 [Azotobacter beijerinckii]MDV7210192.1 phenol hydroxylase subunit P4 [Azotobacter beijerinckii]SFB54718.1 phenol hydroxylase P4 protein [Azotobacter beijerinckii]SFK72589.1 phenol hydroxylase P4 protein [Azotobacter beijerinckii]